MLNPLDAVSLVDLLKTYDDAYFNDDPLVSDAEYDRIKRMLYAIDPSNSYFAQVGSDVRGGKIKLPYPMGSLEQVYENEIEKWVAKYSLDNKNVVITHKYDGASCMLVYRDGKLSIAYSRGNGHEGADITRHIKHIPSVPKFLPGVKYLAVRAEVIIRNSVFQAHFNNDFKNPRNMVAGCMNRSVTEQSTLDKIDVVTYQIVEIEDENISTKAAELNRLKALGFLVAESITVNASDLSDAYLEKTLLEAKSASDYELDGLVLTIDEYNDIVSQRTSDSINPEHSTKYKVLDASSLVETIVVDVLWEISKNGLLKPRIEIVPVDLFGTTVTYTSGFNARYIVDNGIGKGARITMTKAGMVIPFCVGVVKAATPTLPNPAHFGSYSWNDNNVEFVVDDPDNNPIVIFKQVLDFFETLQVDQLREASLTKIMSVFNLNGRSYDYVVSIISDLTEREFVNAVGANGAKMHASLHRRYENMKLETLLGAIKYFGAGFGTRRAKMLLEGIGDRSVWTLTANDIIKIDGFDTKTAQMVVDGMPRAKALIDILSSYITFVKNDKTAELNGVAIVMTGFRDSELQERVEKMGGKVQSAVSKKTTHLLALDTSGNSGKLGKARELGVKVVTPDEFKDEFNL